MTTVVMRDEGMTGQRLSEFSLDLLTETVTVRELLRSRVHQQVKDHNVQRRGALQGIVEPSPDEQRLNEQRPNEQRRSQRDVPAIDWKPYFERAADAFEQNLILVLVDNRQMESLDQQVELKSGSEVVFLRLTPLAGG